MSVTAMSSQRTDGRTDPICHFSKKSSYVLWKVVPNTLKGLDLPICCLHLQILWKAPLWTKLLGLPVLMLTGPWWCYGSAHNSDHYQHWSQVLPINSNPKHNTRKLVAHYLNWYLVKDFLGFVLDVFLGLIAPPEVGVGGTAPWPDPLTSCCAGSPAGLGAPNFKYMHCDNARLWGWMKIWITKGLFTFTNTLCPSPIPPPLIWQQAPEDGGCAMGSVGWQGTQGWLGQQF